MTHIDWRGLGRAYLFFWFFSGVTQALLMVTGATGYLPFRQGLLFSALWLIPLLLWPQRTHVITALIGLPLWLFSMITLGYFIVYGQEFSQSVLFIIFESNPAEASEYLDHYFAWWMLPVLLAYSATAWWLWRRVRPLQMPGLSSHLMALALLAILAFPPAAKAMRSGNVSAERLTTSFMQRMEPALPWKFVFGFLQYREQLAEMQALLEQTGNIPPIAQLMDRYAGEPRTVVLVIGESTNRGHMSLYGYGRQTTPELDALRGQLAVFNQVYAPRPYTIEALQQILTFADQENPGLYLTQPSLMNIMKQAGYKTYWITNQQTLTKRNTMLTSFSQQMDEQVYLNHSVSQNSYQFDGNVLEPFAKILADAAERRFIVVHLLAACRALS